MAVGGEGLDTLVGNRKTTLLLIIVFYFNKTINTLKFNILIELQMLICGNNLGKYFKYL